MASLHTVKSSLGLESKISEILIRPVIPQEDEIIFRGSEELAYKSAVGLAAV